MQAKSGMPDPASDLARQLASIGRAVRDAVITQLGNPTHHRPSVGAALSDIVRFEGGDAIFGIDTVADRVVLQGFDDLGRADLDGSWRGELVMEGFDERIPVGTSTSTATPSPHWTYIVDPIDGTRPLLAGKRSAWVLLGAGRDAETLEDLEVGVAVEIPTRTTEDAVVAYAVRGGPVVIEPSSRATSPRASHSIERTYVTVARFAPGDRARIGAWEDELLRDVETYEDSYLSTGGQMMGLVLGQDAAVIDPRPLFGSSFCAHPYDLAALVVARAAGVIVEALPSGRLDVPLCTDFDVAWAGYANAAIASELRTRMRRCPPG